MRIGIEMKIVEDVGSRADRYSQSADYPARLDAIPHHKDTEK